MRSPCRLRIQLHSIDRSKAKAPQNAERILTETLFRFSNAADYLLLQIRCAVV